MRVLINDDYGCLHLIEAADIRLESEAIVIELTATVESAFWTVPAGANSGSDEFIARYILGFTDCECSDTFKAEYKANPDVLKIKIKNMLIEALRTGFIDFSDFGDFSPEYLYIGNTGCFYT